MAIEGKDREAFYQMQVLADSAFIFLAVKLEVQKVKSIDKGMWAYNSGVAHEQKSRSATVVGAVCLEQTWKGVEGYI